MLIIATLHHKQGAKVYVIRWVGISAKLLQSKLIGISVSLDWSILGRSYIILML